TQRCPSGCLTWITRETSETRTATKTGGSVSTPYTPRWTGHLPDIESQPLWPSEELQFSSGCGLSARCRKRSAGMLAPFSNTRFIAAVIERHTHSPERRRRYWGRSGTESDHGYSTMSPQEDSENPPCNNDPLSAGVDVGNHDDDLDLDTPPQTAALLSHKFHPYRHPPYHHPLHTHRLQAAVTVHSVDAEC
ncbi:unnamed protein product, partial [Oncorhynchus mykiss]